MKRALGVREVGGNRAHKFADSQAVRPFSSLLSTTRKITCNHRRLGLCVYAIQLVAGVGGN